MAKNRRKFTKKKEKRKVHLIDKARDRIKEIELELKAWDERLAIRLAAVDALYANPDLTSDYKTKILAASLDRLHAISKKQNILSKFFFEQNL